MSERKTESSGRTVCEWDARQTTSLATWSDRKQAAGTSFVLSGPPGALLQGEQLD